MSGIRGKTEQAEGGEERRGSQRGIEEELERERGGLEKLLKIYRENTNLSQGNREGEGEKREKRGRK